MSSLLVNLSIILFPRLCFMLAIIEAKELEAISSTLNDGAIANMPSLQNSDMLSRSQACVARFSMDELWYRSSVVQVVDAEHIEVRCTRWYD